MVEVRGAPRTLTPLPGGSGRPTRGLSPPRTRQSRTCFRISGFGLREWGVSRACRGCGCAGCSFPPRVRGLRIGKVSASGRGRDFALRRERAVLRAEAVLRGSRDPVLALVGAHPRRCRRRFRERTAPGAHRGGEVRVSGAGCARQPLEVRAIKMEVQGFGLREIKKEGFIRI